MDAVLRNLLPGHESNVKDGPNRMQVDTVSLFGDEGPMGGPRAAVQKAVATLLEERYPFISCATGSESH